MAHRISRSHTRASLLSLTLFAVACGDDDESSSVDATVQDDGGARPDTSTPDAAAQADASTSDAASLDATVGADASVLTRRGLLAHEPFEYPAGGVAGRAGGRGFAAAWTGGGNVVEAPLTHAVAGQSVVHTGAVLGVTTSSATRDFDTTNLPATLSDRPGKIGAAGQAVWLSLLARSTSPIPVSAWAGVQLFDGDTEQRFIGAPFFSDDPDRRQSWGMDRPGLGGTPIYTDSPVEAPSFLVAKIELGVEITGGETSTGSRVSLWANPGLGDVANLGPADAVLEGPDFRFNRVRVGGEYSGLQVDELRLGETFADVVPSTLASGAVAYVEESFDYTAGALFARAGGAGWASAWSSPDAKTSKFNANTTGLTYQRGSFTLKSSGGAVAAGSGPAAGRRLASDALAKTLSDTAGAWGAPGSELWLAFLARTPTLFTPTGQYAGVSLHLGGYTDPSQRLFIGAPYYDDGAGRLPNWGMDRPGLDVPLYTNVAVSTEATLLVARLQFGTGEAAARSTTVSLWVDPAVGSALPAPQLTLVREDFRFDSVTVNASVEGFVVDELRVGPSLEAVCPSAP